MPSIDRLRLVGAPGLGKIMAGELSRLTRRGFDDKRLAKPVKEGDGAVAFPFDPEVATLATRYHRTCSRVLWDLYRSSAGRLEPLYDDILEQAGADGRMWFEEGATFSIRPRNLQGFAAGERQVVGTIKNALIDGARRRGRTLSLDAEAPQLIIHVSRHDDHITVALDLTGWAMHKRGYRAGTGGIAPLRENLAAALVMLARFDSRSEFLVDPTCGSGTVAIEAALMARAARLFSRPTTADNHFDTQRVPDGPLFADALPRVLANDVLASAAELTGNNAERAGVKNDIVVTCSDLRDLDLAGVRQQLGEKLRTPLIVANLPYGLRLKGEGLTQLYRDIDCWLGGFKGGRAAFLVANPEFEAAMSRRPKSRKPLTNGSQRAYFYLFDL